MITLGRRTEEGELHVPEGAEVEIVETDRGGKSTYHGPGQLVCYPIFDLTRHGQDVKRYCRDLEEALIRTLAAVGVEATRIEGLTGIWVETQPVPRKIASIGVHITKWVTTHGYALNVDLDTAPFTEWITACGLEDASFTTIAEELGRPISVDEVRPHAAAAFEEVFGLSFEELPGRRRRRPLAAAAPRAADREADRRNQLRRSAGRRTSPGALIPCNTVLLGKASKLRSDQSFDDRLGRSTPAGRCRAGPGRCSGRASRNELRGPPAGSSRNSGEATRVARRAWATDRYVSAIGRFPSVSAKGRCNQTRIEPRRRTSHPAKDGKRSPSFRHETAHEA